VWKFLYEDKLIVPTPVTPGKNGIKANPLTPEIPNVPP
jgi:hypothetical protein